MSQTEKAEAMAMPRDINIFWFLRLLRYSERYQISIQFWPKQTAVFIAKDGVDLADFGGETNDTLQRSVEYLDRINGV